MERLLATLEELQSLALEFTAERLDHPEGEAAAEFLRFLAEVGEEARCEQASGDVARDDGHGGLDDRERSEMLAEMACDFFEGFENGAFLGFGGRGGGLGFFRFLGLGFFGRGLGFGSLFGDLVGDRFFGGHLVRGHFFGGRLVGEDFFDRSFFDWSFSDRRFLDGRGLIVRLDPVLSHAANLFAPLFEDLFAALHTDAGFETLERHV